jgi:GNAT superfamily N-acetyltransferase
MVAVFHHRRLDRARGRFRSVVTDLEMRSPPVAAGPPPRPGLRVERWHQPPREDYLALFRRVGEPWLWFGRLLLSRARLAALLASQAHEVWRLIDGDEAIGLCELDCTVPGEIRIAYFGLVPERIGGGLGGFFMRRMLGEAWRRGVQRVWLHTCTEDHPRALDFYRHMGFLVIGHQAEWVRDPRLRGLLPRAAGPHVELPE